ncbi:MAG: SPOR domain-containing protein [Wenzhouxiangellaceae bacterium]|nr:SPOR domain-containing protein [Wenzhouxiangellaceae bacterium]
MDKVLKRRLIGATILIALAVIFLPMLLVDPDMVEGRDSAEVDVPPMPESAREVRRIPLDPQTARVRESEHNAGSSATGNASSEFPDADGRTAVRSDGSDDSRDPGRDQEDRPSAQISDEIVLRPELAEPDSAASDDEASVAAEPSRQAESVPPQRASDEPESLADGPESSLGEWVVQVASFGSRDSAEQVRGQLEALGHIVIRDEIVRGQSLLYRLRTGPYASRQAAERAREQVAATVAGVSPMVRKLDENLVAGEAAGFAVQVGSFVSEKNADNETARLSDLGFEAFRFSEQVGERTIWRVLVGPVDDREQADSMKSRLVERANVEGLVVSYP